MACLNNVHCYSGRCVHISIDGLLRCKWDVIALVYLLSNDCNLLDIRGKENVRLHWNNGWIPYKLVLVRMLDGYCSCIHAGKCRLLKFNLFLQSYSYYLPYQNCYWWFFLLVVFSSCSYSISRNTLRSRTQKPMNTPGGVRHLGSV